MRTWTRLTTLAVLGAGALLSACGKDANNPDAKVSDAKPVDAAPDAGNPDAHVKTRSATLAVTEVKLTDPAGVALGIGGASVSLAFSDLTTGGGNVVFGTGQPGECTVIQYDAGATPTFTPNPLADEGAITLSGMGLAEPGPYTCTPTSGVYTCFEGAPLANQTGTYNTTNNNTTLTVVGKVFNAQDIGKVLNLSGFTDANYNHAFPIISVSTGNAILYTPGVPNTTNPSDKPYTGANMAIIQGAGPVPGGAASVNFLDLVDTATPKTVTVNMDANTDYPTGINVTLPPIGQGIKLNNAGGNCTDCKQPHQFPFSAAGGATVSFSCNPGDGDQSGSCGDTAGLAVGVVITGTTTDGDTTGLPPFAMPPPVAHYATFTCSFIAAQGGQIPNGALEKILENNPTRIETRVFRFAFQLGDEPDTLNSSSVVMGHGLVGHTTKP